ARRDQRQAAAGDHVIGTVGAKEAEGIDLADRHGLAGNDVRLAARHVRPQVGADATDEAVERVPGGPTQQRELLRRHAVGIEAGLGAEAARDGRAGAGEVVLHAIVVEGEAEIEDLAGIGLPGPADTARQEWRRQLVVEKLAGLVTARARRRL